MTDDARELSLCELMEQLHPRHPARREYNELLEALKEILPEGWGDDDTMDHKPGVKKARAAIAKATVAS